VYTAEWNPFTAPSTSPSSPSVASNSTPVFGSPLSIPPPVSPYIPDKFTSHLNSHLFSLLLYKELSPISKNILTYIPTENADDSSGKEPELIKSEENNQSKPSAVDLSELFKQKINGLTSPSSLHSPGLILFISATNIFRQEQFLTRIIHEIYFFRCLSTAIYLSYFFHSEQPLLAYAPPSQDINLRILNGKTISVEESSNEVKENDIVKKQSHILSMIVKGLLKDTDTNLNKRLNVFFDLICMGSMNSDMYLPVIYKQALPAEQFHILPGSWIPISPSSSVIPNTNATSSGNFTVIMCSNPKFSVALHSFLNILYLKHDAVTTPLHFLYALTDYCRICPPLRKWCLTDGLPGLGLYYLILLYILFFFF
jgi:hypothetical protein